jgi:hypothetical protein
MSQNVRPICSHIAAKLFGVPILFENIEMASTTVPAF